MESSSQESDVARKFDYGENQPKAYKDIGNSFIMSELIVFEDSTIKSEPKSSHTFSGLDSSQIFSNTLKQPNPGPNKLHNTFEQKFSTTVRNAGDKNSQAARSNFNGNMNQGKL